jgi:integrase
MKIRLTDLAVKKLNHPDKGQVDYFDTQTQNFGVRCSMKSKSFFVLLGDRKNRKRKTIGRYPDMSLSDARKQARLVIAANLEAAPTASYDYQTVKDAYLADCANRLRPNTVRSYELYLNNINFKKPMHEIDQRQIMRAVETYTPNPSSQNHAFVALKAFFNWSVQRQYITGSPMSALKRPHQEATRERVLSDEELKTLLTYTRENRSRFNDIVTLLVLTGQRKNEIARLQWSEIDDDRIVLPATRTKNKREHVVPLVPMALDLLHNIEGGETYVFGSPFKDIPFNGWSVAQKKLLKETGLAHFTLHDLRRTFSTIHAKIGTPIHVTEKLLNHSSGTISGVAAVYNRHSYLEEMQRASHSHEDYLTELESG